MSGVAVKPLNITCAINRRSGLESKDGTRLRTFAFIDKGINIIIKIIIIGNRGTLREVHKIER